MFVSIVSGFDRMKVLFCFILFNQSGSRHEICKIKCPWKTEELVLINVLFLLLSKKKKAKNSQFRDKVLYRY